MLLLIAKPLRRVSRSRSKRGKWYSASLWRFRKHPLALSLHVNQKICSFPPAVVIISIGTLDVFPGYPTNIGVIEAEPLSIHRILDIGTVMTKVSYPHMGNHSKQFILSSKLSLSTEDAMFSQKDLVQIQALGKAEWVADFFCLQIPGSEPHEVDGQGLGQMGEL